MPMNTFIFYVLSTLILYGGVNTVLRRNPVTCALHLAISMLSLAGLFFHLGAHFIAGVQIVVYAGAVTVLFIMVIMLFDDSDLNKKEVSSHLSLLGLKSLVSICFLGLLLGIIPHSVGELSTLSVPHIVSTKSIAYILFDQYILLFEWVGVLLLIIAVGVVVLSRIERSDSLKQGEQ